MKMGVLIFGLTWSMINISLINKKRSNIKMMKHPLVGCFFELLDNMLCDIDII